MNSTAPMNNPTQTPTPRTDVFRNTLLNEFERYVRGDLRLYEFEKTLRRALEDCTLERDLAAAKAENDEVAWKLSAMKRDHDIEKDHGEKQYKNCCELQAVNDQLRTDLTAAREALENAKKYILDNGDDTTMAPIIEGIESALAQPRSTP